MLTTKQKIKVLQRCIKEIEAINETGHSKIVGGTFYLCFEIGEVAQFIYPNLMEETRHFINHKIAPNLNDYKPIDKDVDERWFDHTVSGNKARIKVLNKLIKELQK